MDLEDIVKSWARLLNASEDERREADRRLEICRKCKNLSSLNICRLCGCPVASMVYTKKSPCRSWNL